MKYYINSFQV